MFIKDNPHLFPTSEDEEEETEMKMNTQSQMIVSQIQANDRLIISDEIEETFQYTLTDKYEDFVSKQTNKHFKLLSPKQQNMEKYPNHARPICFH